MWHVYYQKVLWNRLEMERVARILKWVIFYCVKRQIELNWSESCMPKSPTSIKAGFRFNENYIILNNPFAQSHHIKLQLHYKLQNTVDNFQLIRAMVFIHCFVHSEYAINKKKKMRKPNRTTELRDTNTNAAIDCQSNLKSIWHHRVTRWWIERRLLCHHYT